MYDSNKRARIYLVEFCTDVWFKRHTFRKDRTFTKGGYYLSTDLFNLFDGVALSQKGIIFFQVKTNAWPPTQPLNDFAKRFTQCITIMALNVRKVNGRIQVFTREYPYEKI